MVAQLGFSGGLVTNTNQSTAWARMLVRDASTSIDAVYYNPAGLTKLGDGFHLSLNNQALFQTQTINSTYPYLNNGEYSGDVSATVFPGVYAAWKKGRVAVSFGFNPIGGGGGARFNRGLPGMEIPVSSLLPALTPAFQQMGYGALTGYDVDLFFSGTSVYFGFQGGLSYAINEHISLYAGARFVMAKNTYNGHMKDIKLHTESGATLPASQTMNGISAQMEGLSQQTQAGGDAMAPIIDGGGGDYTFAQLEGAGMISPEQRAQMEGGLLAMGIPQTSVDAMSAAQAQATYYGASAEFYDRSLTFTSLGFVLQDQQADVTQTGSAVTPIVGANFNLLNDKLNIGLKYEFHTKMDLTNSVDNKKGFIVDYDPVKKEGDYMFVDGDTQNADIPAMLSVGVSYKIAKPLSIQVGYHTYFDSKAGWATNDDGESIIDKNFSEYAIGLEYNVTENFLLSAGYLKAITGVNDLYQNDMRYSLTTNTFGGGAAFMITEKLTLQLGGFFTSYDEQTFDKAYDLSGVDIPYEETYDKETFSVSVGIDIKI
ncbi:MAG: hypothetical protein B7C24_05515 [Bacteroidetes bacterium 4572_77]|nr:MAG: hypothetical protein B7C24_05515 [Bacteroidetes bacterium 4572_77]